MPLGVPPGLLQATHSTKWTLNLASVAIHS